MNYTDWFVLVVGTLAVVGFTASELRRRRQAPTRELVRGQPVIFATRAAVLIHARGAGRQRLGRAQGNRLATASGALPVASK